MKRREQFIQLKINGDVEAGTNLKLLKDGDKSGLTGTRCLFWGIEVYRVG